MRFQSPRPPSRVADAEPPNPAPTPGADTVDILTDTDPVALWQPVVGEETLQLLETLRLPDDGGVTRDRLLNEAALTLARCHPPTRPDGTETGLVIGYIQSGKTTNFTTVAALAKDNGFRLVIVCTGVTVNLFEQSRDRLRRDLGIDLRSDREWVFLSNPRQANVEQMIQTALETDRTVLIAVMKNGRHLDNLSHLLGALNLSGVPTLVIDDEADQASLNNAIRRGDQTATYRRVLSLRDLLPHHTFLQYTATPQALLLINLIDVLSPGFADVLTPGPLYTGGRAFFERDMDLIRQIPANEIPSATNPLRGASDSLLEALRVYWLGVAAGLLSDGGRGNRSMMVHPSQRTLPHVDYHQWVVQVQRLWAQILEAGEADPDCRELLDQFQLAHRDLERTCNDLPPFADVQSRLRDAIHQTIVTQVNARRGRTPQPDWRQFYAHIVVGGEVLNRGVTVEGLTVTYMPRGEGSRQADTIQQRARWFGYKADYLGYCRVYLSSPMIAAYRACVDHEEDLRTQLRQHRATGNQLREWRRAFFLDPQLRPTRNSVVSLEPVRGNLSDTWFIPRAPHDPLDSVQANIQTTASFVESLRGKWEVSEGHPRRTPMQIHDVALSVPLRDAFEQLLTRLRLARPVDSTVLAGMLLQVGRYLDNNPGARCTVFQMSQGATRVRDLDDSDEIPTLFQGANYDHSTTPPLMLYPGDREIRVASELTIQIHTVRVERNSNLVADRVPVVAVWVPRTMARAWVSQNQGG